MVAASVLDAAELHLFTGKSMWWLQNTSTKRREFTMKGLHSRPNPNYDLKPPGAGTCRSSITAADESARNVRTTFS